MLALWTVVDIVSYERYSEELHKEREERRAECESLEDKPSLGQTEKERYKDVESDPDRLGEKKVKLLKIQDRVSQKSNAVKF